MLLPIIAQLFLLLGSAPRIAMPLRNAVLRVLRPAESAVRRLIIIAARGLVVKEVEPRPMPKGPIIAKGGTARPPSFQLFDPRKTFIRVRRLHRGTRIEPRITFIGYDPRIPLLWRTPAPQPEPEPAKPVDDGLIDARRLTRRLEALKLALGDLPRQARRLVRWQARRERLEFLRPTFKVPLRPGRPPGYRAEPTHDVDDILIECHRLALDAMRADTS